MLQPTVSQPKMETELCYRLVTESNTQVGLADNGICESRGVSVGATISRRGVNKCVLMLCLNLTALVQEL